MEAMDTREWERVAGSHNSKLQRHVWNRSAFHWAQVSNGSCFRVAKTSESFRPDRFPTGEHLGTRHLIVSQDYRDLNNRTTSTVKYFAHITAIRYFRCSLLVSDPFYRVSQSTCEVERQKIFAMPLKTAMAISREAGLEI